MKVSVVICTYNRAGMLGDTLRSFLSVRVPPGTHAEVLIVDNNSTDATAEISKSSVEDFPGRFRYVLESVRGLSSARNRGITETTEFNVVVFVDDDVYFEEGWLEGILRPFKDHPDTMCAGGKSIPKFETGEPLWVSNDIRCVYGSTNSGDVPKVMHFPEHPYGLNMAFRREVFAIVGLFNVKLGRKKKSLLSSEEQDYFLRVSRAGLVVRYAPDAIVRHRISAERSSRTWVLRRFYWQGVSDVAYERLAEQLGSVDLLRMAGRTLSEVPPAALGILRHALRGRLASSRGMDSMNQFVRLVGRMKQYPLELVGTLFEPKKAKLT